MKTKHEAAQEMAEKVQAAGGTLAQAAMAAAVVGAMTPEPTRTMDSAAQSLFDGHVEEIAQELTALSAHSRNHRDEFASLAAHGDFQRRIEYAILAYLELRCGCGRAATAGHQLCVPCAEAIARDLRDEASGPSDATGER